MIAQCDLHQRYKFVNLPYAEMFDRQPFEMVGKLVSEILDPETYEAANPYMAAALAGKPVDFELKIRTADGTDRSIHTSYAPEFDADGKVTGFVAAITDISELKRVDEALRESNDF